MRFFNDIIFSTKYKKLIWTASLSMEIFFNAIQRLEEKRRLNISLTEAGLFLVDEFIIHYHVYSRLYLLRFHLLGWGDIRTSALCLSFSFEKIKHNEKEALFSCCCSCRKRNFSQYLNINIF